MMISVIMSVYKEPIVYIKKSIESILKQTYRDFEFIIVNDNPESAELGCFLDSYKAIDNRIKIVTNDKNRGLVYSLNRALSVSSGEYIARMDADDYSFDSRLETQLKKAQLYDTDILGAVFCYMDENDTVLENGFCKYYSDKDIRKILGFRNCIPHPSWFVKRTVYACLNGYRNVDCCEDYDFLLRALKHNYKISMCKECLLNYRDNSSGITRSNGYKQIVTTTFLASHRNNVCKLDERAIRDYQTKNLKLKKQKSFERGESILAEALQARKKGRFLRSSFLLLKAMFLSKFVRKHFLMIIKEKRFD